GASDSTDTELGGYVREFESRVRQEMDEIYTRLDDEQTERQLLAGRLNMLFRDRRAHAYTRLLMEAEARMSREARQTVISELLRLDHRRSTETSESRTALQGQITALQGQVTVLQAQKQMEPRRTTRSTAEQETINATTITNAQLQKMIDQGVTAALAARDALRSTNGDDSHNSRIASKRKLENTSRTTRNQQQQQQHSNKRQNTGRVYTTASGGKKQYGGSKPLCAKYNYHHDGPCAPKCHNCNRSGHFACDCRVTVNTNNANNKRGTGSGQKSGCHECGVQGHFRTECPKLKNNNNQGNQGGRNNALARVYAVGRTGADPDANVVTGTKLEIELWELKVKGTDLASYTQRFQELALLCGRMFFEESDKVEKYVGGLPDMIHGSVVASKPKTMQEAIEIATELMDKKVRTFAERETASKRKFENTSRTTRNQQQQHSNKRHNTGRVYTAASGGKKQYRGSRPICAKCNYHHDGPCAPKCHNCKKIGHSASNCRSVANTNNANNQRGTGSGQKLGCYECGVQGHFRRECPKLKNNNNHGNQGGRNNASARVYTVGRAWIDPDANVVT
nr:hypothetical protein [Tanacetum cinerariifolium]